MTITPSEPDERFAEAATAQQIERARESLEHRNISAHVVDTVADARVLLSELLQDDADIFTVSSQTLKLSGIGADIDESERFRSLRSTRLHELDPRSSEARQIGASPHVVVGSAHAVTEDGQIVITSASGSQLSKQRVLHHWGAKDCYRHGRSAPPYRDLLTSP
jgi:hypothetical protein